MSVVELQELEEIKGLLARGQVTGVLTFAEIATAVSELDLDESDVEDLHGFLEKSEIELVEEIDRPRPPPTRSSARPTSAAAAARRPRRWTCART
jgi:RNA polymerase primary sigma factor